MERFLRWLRFNIGYFQKPPWDTGIAPPELMDFISTHSPGSALDLGCGTGSNLVALARAGWKVVGVDFALRAVMKARARLRQAGLEGEAMVDDVTRLVNVKGKFDLILDMGCFHGLDRAARQAYRRNIIRLLSAGGTYLLYAHIQGSDSRPVGIEEAEIERLALDFKLVRREDSQDRWGRTAVWLWFEHEVLKGS